jgi:hypothetical protein
MSQTFAKVINDTLIAATIETSNGIDFIKFEFQVYENCNLVEETYDSFNTYTYRCPLSKFTYYSSNDVDTIVYNQVNLKFGNSVASFNRGEYIDTNGDVFNLIVILNLINIALNLQP